MTPKQKEEFERCKSDPVYFAETHVKVSDSEYKPVALTLSASQKENMKKFSLQKRNLFGSYDTETVHAISAFILHKLIFASNFKITILSNSNTASLLEHDRLLQMISRLPSFLKPEVSTSNSVSITTLNNCSVLSLPLEKDIHKKFPKANFVYFPNLGNNKTIGASERAWNSLWRALRDDAKFCILSNSQNLVTDVVLNNQQKYKLEIIPV